MAVYAIRCGTNGPVKIGHAADPLARLMELQVAHFEPLNIIRVWEGGAEQEALLHRQFADLRIRGEWFSFSRLMLSSVDLPILFGENADSATIAWIGRPPKPCTNAIGRLMHEKGLTDPDLARLVGTSKQQIFKLRTGQRTVSVEWAKLIAPHLGVDWPDLFSDATEVA